jgi:peptidyl-prolyl cis-trans isomerase SurA
LPEATHHAAGQPETMDLTMPRISVTAIPFRGWLAAAVLLAASLGAPALCQAQVVVMVNGSPITAYDIEQRTKLNESSTHKKESRQDIIKELIDERIEISKAKEYGLVVSDEEINQAYASMATRQHITTQQFSELLKRAGLAPETIKERIRAQLTWGQLVRGKFSASLHVGESDIVNALRARNEAVNAVGYIYTLYPVTVVVPSGADAATVEAKRREAEALRGRFLNCKQGLDFARALRDVAVRDPITRSSADLPEKLRDLLGGMEIGRLTAPDQTAQGMQMFAVCDKKTTKTDSPAQHQVRADIFKQRFEREANRYLQELRKAAMIEYKDTNAQSATTGADDRRTRRHRR